MFGFRRLVELRTGSGSGAACLLTANFFARKAFGKRYRVPLGKGVRRDAEWSPLGRHNLAHANAEVPEKRDKSPVRGRARGPLPSAERAGRLNIRLRCAIIGNADSHFTRRIGYALFPSPNRAAVGTSKPCLFSPRLETTGLVWAWQRFSDRITCSRLESFM